MSKTKVNPDYLPTGKPGPVVSSGEFVFAAAHLEHGHIYGQCSALIEAGATLRWVYDPDPRKCSAFLTRFPNARAARSVDEILEDQDVRLVTAAAVPSDRGPLGCRVMRAGKDYFTDKTPFTSLDQLAAAREAVAQTGRKYMVYYSERLHVESAMHALELVRRGTIGRVVQVLGLGPHRLNKRDRPSWFFERARYGGILCDIGSHQIEQFLAFTEANDAQVLHSTVGNFANPDTPEFEDFGEASLRAGHGASGYFRVDWFTPVGLSTWGDGRTLILGTTGTIELRKNVDIARSKTGDHLLIVDGHGEHHLEVAGTVGFKFFGDLILDCLNRTENAMTQTHAFKAAELALQAQSQALRLHP